MPATQRTRFGEILLHAAGLETASLEGYLQKIADTDPTLASEVRRRLHAQDALPETFLSTPAVERLQPPAGPATRNPTPPDGTSHGSGSTRAWPEAGDPSPLTPISERYALGRCLGEGGMARVFEAFDHKLSRPLALKFLTRDDPAVVHHLLREARAQARVRHDHVLEVYDTGELEGKPFIAMALVKGHTLDEVRERTSLEQRVRLLAQVAEGLHAAHRQGLIHRDVKPSNVLVEASADGDLRAFIADFGIASDPQSAAGAAVIAGTPSFMAPELLSFPRGAIDRRVDIYSLGVTMYELFTGAKPHRGDTPIELVQSILHRDPRLPREHLPSLPADLEAIVLRCLARKPDERYASARAVAEDLDRFLAGEVVEAYAASLAYRLTRFALRYKPLLAVAGIAAVALVAASILIAVFAVHAERERDRADARRRQAEALIDFMVVDLRKKLASVERLEVLEELDREALEYFAAVPAHELTDQELADRSRTLYQIGETRFQKGDLAGAVEPFEESLDLARSLSENHPDDSERLFDLGQSYFWVGYVRFRQSDLTGAKAPLSAYLEIAWRLNGIDPEHLEWRLELSYAYSNLGFVTMALGDFEEALEHFSNTLAIDRQLVERNPEDPELRLALGGTHNTVGDVLQSLGRLPEAREHFATDLALDRELVAGEPANHRFRASLGTSLEFLGSLLYHQGDLAAAEAALREARSVSENLVSHDPDNAIRQLELAWRRMELARVAHARGDDVAGGRELEAAHKLLGEGLERNLSHARWRRFLAISHYHLGAVAAERSAGRSHLRAALEILDELREDQPEDRKVSLWLAKSLLLAGSLAQEDGEPETARELWERSARTLAPLARGSRDGRILTSWAQVLLRLGRSDEARLTLGALRDQGFRTPDLAALCRDPELGCAGLYDER